MPKVSVITPVYNGQRFIGAAIDSVLSQTLTDWELIVVDDGSTDETAAVLRTFTDPRISVFTQANQGEAAARNRALELAKGEYVAFLDSDDLYLPDALEHMSAYLDAQATIDVVYSDGFFCDEQGRELMRLSEHRPGPYTGNILEQLILNPSVITFPVCTMVRHATLERSQVRFDPDLVYPVDWDFWIQFSRSAQFGYLDRLTCKYRIHGDNMTVTNSRQKGRLGQIRGRRKLLNEPWFNKLSPETRQTFFYQLLIDLLSGDIEAQEETVRLSQFRELPAYAQGVLLRHIGVDWLITHQDWYNLQDFLRRAIAVCPTDKKTQLLQKASQHGPGITRLLLQLWRPAVRIIAFLTASPETRRRPAPSALAPAGE